MPGWRRASRRRGKAKAAPTIAVVRISFSFMRLVSAQVPGRCVVYHSERAGSRERTFSSDIDYSRRPAASALLLRPVIDEREALPLVLELREVAPAAVLALLLAGRHARLRRPDGDARRGNARAADGRRVLGDKPPLTGSMSYCETMPGSVGWPVT